MNYAMFAAYAIVMVLAPVVPFLVYRCARLAREVYKALRVLQLEKRAGESLYDTAEAIAGDAHNWRGMTANVADLPLTEVNYRQANGRIFRKGQESQRVVFWDPAKGESSVEAALMVKLANGAPWCAPQPPPQNSEGPALWPMIISELGDSETDRLVAIDMQQRHEFGVAKYGVPLVASNGRDHLADAYQEALDGVVYLRADLERLTDRVAEYQVSPEDYKAHSRTSQLYIDMLDLAKEIRELIRERDGR